MECYRATASRIDPNWRSQVARGQLAGYSRATTLLLRTRKVKHMEVITLHLCKRCGKIWFPRTPGIPRICPTVKPPIGTRRRRKEKLMKTPKSLAGLTEQVAKTISASRTGRIRKGGIVG
jgi:hypothetical protein